jgi:hypothetical protein
MPATRRWGLEVCDPIATEGLADADLALVLAAGNQDALLELYDRYAGLAYAVAMRVLGDPGRAEDVVQEAFLRITSHMAHHCRPQSIHRLPARPRRARTAGAGASAGAGRVRASIRSLA